MAAGLSTLKRDEVQVINTFEYSLEKPIMGWKEENIMDRIQAFISSKALGNVDVLKNFIREICKDLTFLEVYENNGWILNITVTDSKFWGK